VKTLLTIVLLTQTTYLLGQQKPVMRSLRAQSDLPLTTDPASSFWRATKPIYAKSGKNGDPLSQYRTEIRSGWTKTNIYFLFICPYKQLYLKPNPDIQHETYELWNWNVAEVFIGSDFKNIKRYKEFELSPHDEWIDLDIDLTKPHHEEGWTWNSGFEHTARIDEKNHIWYAALKIPFKALDDRPVKVGNTFRVNFFRTEGGPKNSKEIVWQPVMGETFHVPERFGLLRLTTK